MFLFSLSFPELRRRLQVAGGAQREPKGAEEAGGEGAGGAAGSGRRDAATPAGKFVPPRLSSSPLGPPAPILKFHLGHCVNLEHINESPWKLK